ncbi:MAG TPA: hypothetical protein VJR94_01205 [Candidatus Nitrosocosmicus sp.]|nr:hypothetical protein [Candidatus Nitrosocosmicus sp.]
MSQSVYTHTNSAFVKQLLALDKVIVSKIQDNVKNDAEAYQIYLERLSLFEKSCILPLSEDDKSLLQNIREDIYLEFKLYKLKSSMKTQINKIKTELDGLGKDL